MGWFGSDTTNVVVSNAANGKAEARVNIPVPFWEIVLIAACVATIVYLCCVCSGKKLKKEWNKQVKVQVAKSRCNLEDV
jgi:uncharacterized protein (DUF697 family)